VKTKINQINFVKIGTAVPEICLQTDTHTDRQTSWSQYSVPLPGKGNKRVRYNNYMTLLYVLSEQSFALLCGRQQAIIHQ